ncbi:uncharacterized protein MICPUCDRAFT_49837 [Micromonas pusilla CCMP1545]|uniref:Predicted protein n=1 Tax=Micromonas pusilla (strain CCMP1545) TaxID=564608 RepID=C1MGJ5_MICPC|nr:uncharacterized protein MICPUCDRAFT_49837 [Micromonas pusilla CCMP1545]EEH60038.1 predicted protein [Micromonas pusilla CCMP1545]|eukprot:XP_003054786.1 predicted protein [Micromonas pusilla CCMP1545]
MHAAAGTTLKASRASRTPTLSRPRRAARVLRAASRPRRRGARLAASAKQSAHDDDISDVRLATSAALASATVAATISLAFSVDATLTAMMSAVGLEVAEMEYSTRSARRGRAAGRAGGGDDVRGAGALRVRNPSLPVRNLKGRERRDDQTSQNGPQRPNQLQNAEEINCTRLYHHRARRARDTL